MQCKFQRDQGDALTKYGGIRAVLPLTHSGVGRLTFVSQMLYSRAGMKPDV